MARHRGAAVSILRHLPGNIPPLHMKHNEWSMTFICSEYHMKSSTVFKRKEMVGGDARSPFRLSRHRWSSLPFSLLSGRDGCTPAVLMLTILVSISSSTVRRDFYDPESCSGKLMWVRRKYDVRCGAPTTPYFHSTNNGCT